MARTTTRAPSTAPTKANKAKPRTTGRIRQPAKGGVGKAHIAEAGGGRAALLRWRALTKEQRQTAITNNTVAKAAGVKRSKRS